MLQPTVTKLGHYVQLSPELTFLHQTNTSYQ